MRDKVLLALAVAWERAVASRSLNRMIKVEVAAHKLNGRFGIGFYDDWAALINS